MWKDLNMKERAAFIKVAVDNGILNINDIIGHYNKFAEGGLLDNDDNDSIPITRLNINDANRADITARINHLMKFNNISEEEATNILIKEKEQERLARLNTQNKADSLRNDTTLNKDLEAARIDSTRNAIQLDAQRRLAELQRREEEHRVREIEYRLDNPTINKDNEYAGLFNNITRELGKAQRTAAQGTGFNAMRNINSVLTQATNSDINALDSIVEANEQAEREKQEKIDEFKRHNNNVANAILLAGNFLSSGTLTASKFYKPLAQYLERESYDKALQGISSATNIMQVPYANTRYDKLENAVEVGVDGLGTIGQLTNALANNKYTNTIGTVGKTISDISNAWDVIKYAPPIYQMRGNVADAYNSTYAKGGKINKVNPSAVRALNYFVGKGLSREQAAGIVGNLMTESELNTRALNPYSGAYGIAQWLGSRKTALFNKYGKNPTLDQQLDFIWHELNSSHSRGLRMLKGSSNVNDAAANAFGYYEFSAGPQAAVRAMNAAGMNTKWKNPDGTIRLNEGIKNANILLGMNPNYNPAFNRPPISSTINLSLPNIPVEIPQYKVNLALLEQPRQDNQLGLFNIAEPIQEQQEEPRQDNQIATLMNILDSIGKPSERQRERVNNYTIHI